MEELVTRAELARRAGVTKAAVTKQAQNGLSIACKGNRIDVAHPKVRAYVEKQRADQTEAYASVVTYCLTAGVYTVAAIAKEFGCSQAKSVEYRDRMRAEGMVPEQPPHVRGYAARKAKRAAEAPEEFIPNVPGADITEFLELTLRELVDRFGTATSFLDWLNATKRIEDIAEKRLKNATTEGELVSRELVHRGIIEPIEAAHIKLLSDGAKTIAVRLVAMHEAGRTQDDLESFVRDQITSFIRPIKAKVRRTLKE